MKTPQFQRFLFPALLAFASSAAAVASPIVVNGNFGTPSSSSVQWGTLSPVGGSVGGPGTVTWGPGQYGYTGNIISTAPDGSTFTPASVEVTATPEPGTLLLLGLAFVAFRKAKPANRLIQQA